MVSRNIKNICCIGAGYVGGPTMSIIALKCPDITVNVVDINSNRIKAWNSENLADLPVFEPGLDDVIRECRGRNLYFSTSVEESIAMADIIFISVNTPTKETGLGAGFASDLKWIESSARTIAKFAKGHTIVVEKSTLPVKTAETIKKILYSLQDIEEDKNNNNPQKTFSIVSNPEFLSEGTAINDLLNPDRVLIGGEDNDSIDKVSDIYNNWITSNKIITTNLWSSELSKLVANAFLAQRISSINAISSLCESTGANIQEVAMAIGSDTRIGNKFLNAGPGFGGSCFKKDILNLVYLCRYYGLNEVADYWEAVVKINSWQQKRISSIIVKNLFGTLANKKLAIFGFSFKADTNDTRESPSINISQDLLQEGAQLAFYDPRVKKEQILKELNSEKYLENIQICKTAIDAATGADAVIILTDWKEFLELNWSLIYKSMRKPSWIFDARICLDNSYLKNLGFNVWTLGS